MIDHEPRELPETARAGVDLDISGHTHDGQFFPLNLTQYFIWPNPYGIQLYGKNGEEIDDARAGTGRYGDPETEDLDTMTSFVTSGAGVYGPNMRVGTNSEVVRLEVTFRK
jgi:predicted MPP superfamily phosphohydrolase